MNIPRAAFAILLLACADGEQAVKSDSSLSDGRRISDLAAESPLLAVLVFDPAECVTCGGTLREWVRLHQRTPSRIALVLSREPNAVERRLLRSLRIAPTAILGAASQEGAVFQGRELLFVRQLLVTESDADFGAAAPYSSILRRLAAEGGAN